MHFSFHVKKDDNPELTLDKYTVEVEVGDDVVVKVIDGVSPFEAKSDDESIAKATMSGKDITIEGVAEGSTQVKVSDKDGTQKTIAVTVKDTYAGEKENVTARVAWGEIKDKGKGTLILIKDPDKNAIFTWEDADAGESLVVSLIDPEDKIGGTPEEPESKLATRDEDVTPLGKVTYTVKDAEPEEYDVTAWKVIQTKPAEEGAADTYWVVFTANDEEGIFVSPLTIE